MWKNYFSVGKKKKKRIYNQSREQQEVSMTSSVDWGNRAVSAAFMQTVCAEQKIEHFSQDRKQTGGNLKSKSWWYKWLKKFSGIRIERCDVLKWEDSGKLGHFFMS